MFNPLNFFKKKSTELSGFENSASEPVVEKKIQIDNVAVHTMPERFRHLPAKAEGAKTAGFLIMGGGLVFLIAVSVLAYFYLFKQPAGTVKEEQPAVRCRCAAPGKKEQRQHEEPGAKVAGDLDAVEKGTLEVRRIDRTT